MGAAVGFLTRVCPGSLLLPQPQAVSLSGTSAHQYTPGEIGFGFRAAQDLTRPWDISTSHANVFVDFI